MNPDGLREHLLKLHEELSAAQRVDPGSQQLLGDIMGDIKRLLQQAPDASDAGSAATLDPAAPARSLPERLEGIAVQFEAAHPRLAASSRRLVALLGQVGL